MYTLVILYVKYIYIWRWLQSLKICCYGPDIPPPSATLFPSYLCWLAVAKCVSQISMANLQVSTMGKSYNNKKEINNKKNNSRDSLNVLLMEKWN